MILETFSAAAAQIPMTPLTAEAQQALLDGGHRPQPSMVSLDPPDHERLRGPAARAFTPARVAAMEGPIRQRTRTLLDAVAGETTFDLIHAVAFPLPALTIFDMLAVPEDDIAQLKEWCGARALLTFGRPVPDQQLEIARNIVAYRRYLPRPRGRQDRPAGRRPHRPRCSPTRPGWRPRRSRRSCSR